MPSEGDQNLMSLYRFLVPKVQDPEMGAEKARVTRGTIERLLSRQADILVAAAQTLAGVYGNNGQLFVNGQRRLDFRRQLRRG